MLNCIEEVQGISLPSEYRELISILGDGGAGPYYGLRSLADAIKAMKSAELREPFPHTELWNPQPEFDSFWRRRQWEDDVYFADHHIDGALPVFPFGCNIEILLVVSGAERGNLWFDSRSDDEGIYPYLPGDPQPRTSKRCGFFQAYEAWLETASRKR